MLCEKCGKNVATTHIKTVINGTVTEHNYCAACAAEHGYSQMQGGSLADMLISMLGGASPDKITEKALRCPICGSDFSDIAKTGKAGCTECYKTFYSELLPYLKRLHGSVNHIGKTPEISAEKSDDKEEEITSLRKQLQELVSAEKYEDAALIRDKIKELEGEES